MRRIQCLSIACLTLLLNVFAGEDAPPPPPTPAQIEAWVKELDADDFHKRHEAEQNLKNGGRAANDAVRVAIKKRGLSPELFMRLTNIWTAMDGGAEWERLTQGPRHSIRFDGNREGVFSTFQNTYGIPLRLNGNPDIGADLTLNDATWQEALAALCQRAAFVPVRVMQDVQLQLSHSVVSDISNGVLMVVGFQPREDNSLYVNFSMVLPSIHFEPKSWTVESLRVIGADGEAREFREKINSRTSLHIPKDVMTKLGTALKVEIDIRLLWPGLLQRREWKLPLAKTVDEALSEQRALKLEALAKDNEFYSERRVVYSKERGCALFGRLDYFDHTDAFYFPNAFGSGSRTETKGDKGDVEGVEKSRHRTPEIRQGKVAYIYSDDPVEHRLKFKFALKEVPKFVPPER